MSNIPIENVVPVVLADIPKHYTADEHIDELIRRLDELPIKAIRAYLDAAIPRVDFHSGFSDLAYEVILRYYGSPEQTEAHLQRLRKELLRGKN